MYWQPAYFSPLITSHMRFSSFFTLVWNIYIGPCKLFLYCNVAMSIVVARLAALLASTCQCADVTVYCVRHQTSRTAYRCVIWPAYKEREWHGRIMKSRARGHESLLGPLTPESVQRAHQEATHSPTILCLRDIYLYIACIFSQESTLEQRG